MAPRGMGLRIGSVGFWKLGSVVLHMEVVGYWFLRHEGKSDVNASIMIWAFSGQWRA